MVLLLINKLVYTLIVIMENECVINLKPGKNITIDKIEGQWTNTENLNLEGPS